MMGIYYAGQFHGNSDYPFVHLNEQQLKSLIDVTLVLGDRAWFLELTMRLKAVKKW